MRKTVLLLASMALTVLLVSGVAWAITKDCKAGADYCIGTNQPDTLNGSDVRDKIYGQDADDKLFGNGGNDTLKGGDGNDTMFGGEGSDTSNTEQGDDKVYGGSGYDDLTDYKGRNVLSGGGGGDWLYGHGRLVGGSGKDTLDGSYSGKGSRTFVGGSGEDRMSSFSTHDDTFYARDGERDNISCGGGTDTVYFDKGIDSVNPINCEKRIGK